MPTRVQLRSSSDTRSAIARAAIRLGCVQPTNPLVPLPASRQSFGSWVVLPDPVSPATTITWCSLDGLQYFLTMGGNGQGVIIGRPQAAPPLDAALFAATPSKRSTDLLQQERSTGRALSIGGALNERQALPAPGGIDLP